MGVITQKGVVGIVQSSSKNYSIVISLLHNKTSVGIKLKKNNHFGILKWNGYNYKEASINKPWRRSSCFWFMHGYKMRFKLS